MVRVLAKEPRNGGDEPTIGRLENNGCGRPLPECGIDSPGMDDERDTAVEELPAYERTVCIPKIEIQYTRREVSMTRQTQCLVQMRSGEHLCGGSLQAPRSVEADQRLVLDEKNGSSR